MEYVVFLRIRYHNFWNMLTYLLEYVVICIGIGMSSYLLEYVIIFMLSYLLLSYLLEYATPYLLEYVIIFIYC